MMNGEKPHFDSPVSRFTPDDATKRWVEAGQGSTLAVLLGPEATREIPTQAIASAGEREALPEPPFGVNDASLRTPYLEEGQVFDHYRVDQKLGEGGMGTVYRCTDLKTGEPVAIKIIQDPYDLPRVRQFYREVRIWESIDHLNVVKMLRCGMARETGVYMVLEFCHFPDLEQQKARYKTRDPEEIMDLAEEFVGVADALDKLHERRTVHADVKPANILLALDGELKLTDFGIALAPEIPDLDGSPVEDEARFGSSTFASPEQWRIMGGAADVTLTPASDAFSFGATLYYLYAGRYILPFEGKRNNFALLHMMDRFSSQTPDVKGGKVEIPPLRSLPGMEAFPEPIARFIEQLLHPDEAARLPKGGLRKGLEDAIRASRVSRKSEIERVAA